MAGFEDEPFETFLEKILLHGLEHYRKFYGIYRGQVTRVDDPQKRGRIQAHVPAALQTTAPDVWIDPAFDGAGTDRGMFWPPEVGDSVRVAFERGDPRRPCLYWGGWYGIPSSRSGVTEVPVELGYPEGSNTAPTRRGLVTRMGHAIIFDDTSNEEMVRLVWHKAASDDAARTTPATTADRLTGETAFLEFTAAGATLQDALGTKVQLDTTNRRIYIEDVNGNKVTIDSAGVKVEGVQTIDLDAAFVNLAHGNDTFAVRGRDLMQWLTSHWHPTPMGPSGPPGVLPPATILSKNVRLK